LALSAQDLTSQPDASPLARVEADLRLLLADLLVTYPDWTPSVLQRLNSVQENVEQALVTLTVLKPLPCAKISGEVAVSSDAVDVLQWIAQTLWKLHEVTRTITERNSAFTFAQLQIAKILKQLQGTEITDDAIPMLHQMFLTDLHVWSLNAHRTGNAGTSLWYVLIASAFALQHHINAPAHGDTRLALALALEAELADIDPEASDLLKRQWPLERRGLPAIIAPRLQTSAALSDVVATYRCALRWTRWAAEERDPALRKHLEQGSGRWVELGQGRQQLAEYRAQRDLGGVVSKSQEMSLDARIAGREKATEAVETGLQALRVGKQNTYDLCRKVCSDLEVITNCHCLVYRAVEGDRAAMQCTERNVTDLLTCADHYLRAAAADLAGCSSIASTWRSAAQLRDGSMNRKSVYGDLRYMPKDNASKDFQRADALAEKALRMEAIAARKP
jgi:hypothetical protein